MESKHRCNFSFLKQSQHKCWCEVDSSVYEEAYNLFGGSFIMHPQVIAVTGTMASISTRYLASYQDGELVGALPLWGKYLAGDKRYLKKMKKRRIFDTGNAEVILPLSKKYYFSLAGFRGQFISELHREQLDNVICQPETLSLARSFKNGDFSSKFRYNRRRELKMFQQDGGEVVVLEQLASAEIATIYIQLFFSRWGKKPKGHERLAEFISGIFPFVKGHLLKKDTLPVAIQLIYLVKSSTVMSAEYINGGLDPQFKKYSPGSILSFLNINYAEELAVREGLPLRFSFGLTDKQYKNTWCVPHPVYRV